MFSARVTNLAKTSPWEHRQANSLLRTSPACYRLKLLRAHSVSPGLPANCRRLPFPNRSRLDSTGEMFRSILTEIHKGVPLHLDVLVLEHSTCKPVTDQFVVIW